MIGYARSVSSPQSLARQRAALLRAGCTEIFQDDASGGRVLRPGLLAAHDSLSTGGALCLVSLDRLARSSRDLFYYTGKLSERGFHLVSLAEDIDTRRDNGAFFSFCSLVDRLHGAGAADRLAVDRARAVRGPGPSPRLTDDVWSELSPRLAAGELTVSAAAEAAGVHRSTIYRRQGG
ncbi:MAG: recombinase family protein [Brevundimonas sp.]|nr:recombinase family protein [Brevundimonas sp.]MDI6625898.1 recombinase family protein [Brevundimonas sp.]